jgi:hypothetical protein
VPRASEQELGGHVQGQRLQGVTRSREWVLGGDQYVAGQVRRQPLLDQLHDLSAEVVDHEQPPVVSDQPADHAGDHHLLVGSRPLGEFQELGQVGQVAIEDRRLLAAKPEPSLPVAGTVAT